MDGDLPHRQAGDIQPLAGGRTARLARRAPLVPVEPPSALPPTEREAAALADFFASRKAMPPADIDATLTAVQRTKMSFGQVAMARGYLSEADVLAAQAAFHGTGFAEIAADPPDPAVAAHLPATVSLATETVLWRDTGGALVVATARPDLLDRVADALPGDTRLILALAPRDDILAAQRAIYGPAMARAAEARAPEQHSCRGWQSGLLTRAATVAGVGLCALLATVPTLAVVSIFAVALAVYFSNCALKFAAFAAALRDNAYPPPEPVATPLRLPTVTLLVPLYREPEVAGALVERLRKIDYPREHLDVILAVEEDDPTTLDALRKGVLPAWMRAVIVPRGHPQTKPRALNYALNYARGEIVGIYDAEDRPEPDQIHKIVQRFAAAPPEVACLQGRLDYYNARHNWMAGLFTIEYAAWFRVLLPGVARMGLVVPLGGTTVFLRRHVLEQAGAWDAHNVTEDAELGLRLVRMGYVTEIIDTTTFEEANAAALPWIRQRSRWLKGYLMTWGAAMRRPRRLLAELGAWRFAWIQVQFLGAVAGFLTAPLLWSLMVKPFGLWHPLDAVLSPLAYGVLATAMVAGLVGSIAISVYATRAAHLRHLRPKTPLVEPYYLLGTLAAWVGLFEIMARPFFWAKTRHGAFGGSETDRDIDP